MGESIILIADDNSDLRMLLKLMLTGHKVLEAGNGQIALEIFKEYKPDLVLMDILMPEMDGIEATREIMRYDPKAKIIAITAYSNQAQSVLAAGARQVVAKPIRRKELLKLIRENTYKNS